MGRKIIFFILLCFLFFNKAVWAQNSIQGTINDEFNKPITSVSVILKDSIGKIITYNFSDSFGKYNLKTDKLGKFTLFFNSMDYEQQNFAVLFNVIHTTKNIDVKLQSKVIDLEEIVINSVRPITKDGDKIIYDAQSFSQGNEEVVEDLLKKIPGLNISSDGTIKVGNQEIEKIMINNDDMFDKGYKILTKNMPVNPIDKIELLQNYSNNKHLKGIENSNKVAINLTLKEDYERQWFGNLQSGYGTTSKNTHEFKGNLMNFGNKSKYYFLINFNNIGYDPIGDIDNLIKPNRQDEFGDNQSSNSLLKFGEDLPNLNKKRINFNNSKMLSLNSIFNLTDHLKLKILGFLNSDENVFYKNKFQFFSIGNTSFENTEEYLGKKTQLIGFGKIDLIYDLSNNKTIEYTGKLNKTNAKNRSDLVFNKELLNERLQSNNELFDQKIVFTNKFKDNKVFFVTGRYINEKTPQNYAVNQFLFSELFSENAENTVQFSENKMQFTGLETQLLNRKQNGDLFELKLGTQFRIDFLNSIFQLKKGEAIISEPEDYQNNLKYSNNDFYLSTKYIFKFNTFSLSTQLDFHQLFNHFQNEKETKKQNPFYMNPKIGLEWKINSKNKINTSYSYNTTNAKVLDVYTNYIQTGFQSFLKGTNHFNQLNTSNLIFNYSLGNFEDKFFANTFILYSKNHDYYSTNSLISQNFNQSEKIIIKNQNFFTISSSIDRYFKTLKSNLKLTIGGSKINFENMVNNSNLRKIKNNSVNYGFEFRSAFNGIFNYHIGSKWNYNEVKTITSNSFTDNMTFLDVFFRINDRVNIQAQSERYHFRNLDNNNNVYYFLDMNAKYVIKQNKLTASLSGHNLFNTKTFNDYNITDISISKTEYRLLPRYIMLKMEFRF